MRKASAKFSSESFEVLGFERCYWACLDDFEYLLDALMQNKYSKPIEAVEQNVF